MRGRSKIKKTRKIDRHGEKRVRMRNGDGERHG